jgi:hypothetical protein
MKLFAYGDVGLTPQRRKRGPTLVVIIWTVIIGLSLAGNLGSADAASPTTTAPVTTTAPATTTEPATTTSEPATTVATTVPSTVATTIPTTATTSVTSTTEPTTTTTTASTTSTTKRRIVVGIAATRGLVVTETSGDAQSGWIAFGILLVVVLGLAVAWFVRERRRQGPAGGTNKPAT